MQLLEREAQIPFIVKSKFIPRVIDCVKSKQHYFLIQEYCNGGSLAHLIKKLKRLRESEAYYLIR